MSISKSSDKIEEVKVPITARVSYSLKKINIGFFKNPIRYIFYYTLVGIIITLLIGKHILPELWLVFGVICFSQVFQYIKKQKDVYEDPKLD